jgi:GTP-binding protein
MKVTSAEYVTSVIGTSKYLDDTYPQIAFIGRSNVGKSSLINAIMHTKNLAITSSFPGRTQLINIFLLNKKFHLIDLPGYGYAKVSAQKKEDIEKMIAWYLLEAPYKQKKVVVILDAVVGITDKDKYMIGDLLQAGKDVIIAVNKIDKLGSEAQLQQLATIQGYVGNRDVIPVSTKTKVGVNVLSAILFG